jgi:hypothetical protein
MVSFGLTAFSYSPGDLQFYAAKLPPGEYRRMSDTLSARQAWPLRQLEGIVYATAIGALIVMATGILALRRRPAPSSDVVLFSVIVVVGLLLNAMICGGIAIVHDRYQGRVIWLLPLIAALLYSASRTPSALDNHDRPHDVKPTSA